jgi:putative iron-regulated protein
MRIRSSFVVLAILAAACGSDENDAPAPSPGAATFPTATAESAIADYKRVVSTNYEDAVTKAKALDAAVQAFVAAPSPSTQDAAKSAWIAARVPYGPSEVFRFYDGPIDDPDSGPEGALNGWPLDENYIDYTRDDPDAGLVNDLASMPTLSAELLLAANEAKGEKAIATGYHAIEFLLWGQDDETPGTGAGKRPHTDYLDATAGGTAKNPDRRRTYLTTVSSVLVSDLEGLRQAWDTTRPDSFGSGFGVTSTDGVDPRKDAVAKILVSLHSLSKKELSGERMMVAFNSRSQEDEHSCFSDNTSADLYGNGLGIENVWLGRYGSFDGVGIDEVVRAVDPTLADTTTADIATSVAKLKALAELQAAGKPLDVVIQSLGSSPERAAMGEAIEALKQVGTDVEKCASALGVSIGQAEPDAP